MILIAAAGCSRQGPDSAGKTVSIGSPAPEFSLESADGGRVVLKNLRGKVVLVDFWATWCPPCRDAMEDFERFHSRFAKEDLEIVAVAVQSDREAVAAFVEKHGITSTVLFDDGKATEAYDVTQIPALFLIDRNGVVVHWAAGYSPDMGKRLEEWIEEALR